MLQCLSRAVKELGWLFPLCHPQGIRNVFLQDLRMAALPFHSHRAAPKQKEFFSPFMSLFLREVSFLKPPANFPLHLT